MTHITLHGYKCVGVSYNGVAHWARSLGNNVLEIRWFRIMLWPAIRKLIIIVISRPEWCISPLCA